MSPHVCQVITRLDDLGGAQMHVLHLAWALVERGWRVTVVGGRPGAFADLLDRRGIPWVSVPSLVQPISPWRDARAEAELSRLFQTLKPDLVAAHSSKAGILARLAARRLGIPVVFTAHGWAFQPEAPPVRRGVALAAERVAGRWADRIICVSEHDRRLALAARVAPPERIVTVRNGIPDDPARAEPGRPGRVSAVMVARFAPPKDHTTLLAAVSRIEDLDMVLVGDGPQRAAVEREVAQRGLTGRVQVLGSLPDVAPVLAQAHVFVLCSRWEGLPLTILEAMRAGLPVVASDVGGIREAVVEGQTGFLVPTGNVEALERRLRTLVANPELRQKLGTAGRRRYEEAFRLERMVAETLAVYRGVLKRRTTMCGGTGRA